jgi:hypothetical protein|tara:strand:- start:7636 stop:7941 length:306 start_codon:yes stop_codon:yes gene_type:complete
MAKAKVVIVEEEKKEVTSVAPTWYNSISSSQIDKWRVWPRMLITLYGVMFYRTTEWFMSLPDPTNAQSAFISVIVGAGAAWFGLYCGSGGGNSGGAKKDKD